MATCLTISTWYVSAAAPPTVRRCLFLDSCFCDVSLARWVRRKRLRPLFTLVADVESSFQGLFTRLFQGPNLSSPCTMRLPPPALRASERVNPLSCFLRGFRHRFPRHMPRPRATICIHPTQGGRKGEVFGASFSSPPFFFLFPLTTPQFAAKLLCLELLTEDDVIVPSTCGLGNQNKVFETCLGALSLIWEKQQRVGVNVVFITTAATTTNDGNCNI